MTLEAEIDPSEQETTYILQYAETPGGLLSDPKTAGTGSLSGAQPQRVGAEVSGLRTGTTYYYRALAENQASRNEGKPAEGAVQSFPWQPPQLGGEPQVGDVTQRSAVISPPPIDPEIQAPLQATYYVTYGTAQANESVSPPASAGSGLASNPVDSVLLDGLEPGKTYHYTVVAYNAVAEVTSPPGVFTTPATPPSVNRESVLFVNEDGATIESELDSEGLETTYEVQYGASVGYGTSAPVLAPLTPAGSPQDTFIALAGLAPGTTYHYRILATNTAGTSYGPDETFTTTGATPTSTFTSFSVPTTPLVATTPATFPPEEKPTASKTPTSTKKLKAALKRCKKDVHHKRDCERKPGPSTRGHHDRGKDPGFLKKEERARPGVPAPASLPKAALKSLRIPRARQPARWAVAASALPAAPFRFCARNTL